MQRWCPEPFATAATPESPEVVTVFRGVGGAGSAGAAAPAGTEETQQFRRETGYTDPQSLLATLTRQERADIYELAEQDVAGAYEARQAEQVSLFEANLAETRRETEARLAEWTAGMEEIVREDLSRAAAGAARLAVQIAGKLVREIVAVDHGVLTRALETVLHRQRAASPLQVWVSPADADWLNGNTELRSRMNIEAVAADRRLGDGDCRVRSDGREWDLTIDGQLETLGEIIAEALATRSRGEAAAPEREPA